jgi:tRNA pseudouridine38-40 synthase
MKNLCITLSYDGYSFFGWQKTKTEPSIEKELEDALFKILQKKIYLQAASRTDRGVHANEQIVNFLTDKKMELSDLQYRLNRLLPNQIAIKKIEEKPYNFHPSLDSIKKEYHYNISYGSYQLPFKRHYFWHFAYPLNLDLIKNAAKELIGKHNFQSFSNQKEVKPVRELFSIEIFEIEKEEIQIRIIGNSFLYKMVRNIVGTLAYIGCNKLRKDSITEILKSKNRTNAGVTAPANGLILHRVYYNNH